MPLLKTRNYFVLAAVALTSLALTVSAYQWVNTQAFKLIEQDFNQSASSYADFLSATLNQRVEDLKSVGRFYSASSNVTRKEFSNFVDELVSRQDRFLAMMWLPRVLPEQRIEFEAEVSRELGFPYRIKGGTAHNMPNKHDQAFTQSEATKKSRDLTPVLYVEPLAKNLHALGYDLSSDAHRRDSLSRAARLRQPVASERITLIHEGNDPTGFLIALAIFDNNLTEKKIKPDENPIGYLVGRMSAYQVINNALKRQTSSGISIALRDLNAPIDNQVFVRLGGNENNMEAISSTNNQSLVLSQPIDFAGHKWQVDVIASPYYISSRKSLAPLMLLIVGILVTTVLMLYLRGLMSQQHRAEQLVQKRTAALDSSKARLDEAQRIAHIGSWELDLATRMMEWSDEVYRILELTPNEVNPARYNTFLSQTHPDDRSLVEYSFSEHLKTQKPYNITYRLLMHDGRVKFVQERCETHFDDTGKALRSLGTMQDITERKQAEERILFLAHHDDLTGLPNRVLFQERFEQALYQAHRDNHYVALIFLDLDRFKFINDSLGHPTGDAMLKEVAKRLSNNVREVDILARHGGDEFLIALTNINRPEIVADITEKILTSLKKPFELDGHSLGSSSSIGISIYPDDGDEFDILLRKSDTAMYSAKEAGRDTYRFFTEQMNVDTLERLKMLGRIRAALEANEFQLYYQPQVDLASGKIIGMEALLRWQDVDGSFISPDKFISAAEESGVILPLGDWVMKKACHQLAEWRDKGFQELSMAVNLSALQLRQDDIVACLDSAATEAGVPPQCVELELTESVLLEDMESNLQTVQQLKAIGFKLAIDDFGTGYSSLSYVRQLGADKLKIDRSFVRDIDTDVDSTAIVRAVTHMAHDLRIQIIAEGVERKEQAQILSEIGCDSVQGYYYSHPVPSKDLLSLLEASRLKPV